MNYLNQLKQLDKDQEAEGIMNWRIKKEISNIETFNSIGETLKRMKNENAGAIEMECACGGVKSFESEFCKECI